MALRLEYTADSAFFAEYLSLEEKIKAYVLKITYTPGCPYPVSGPDDLNDMLSFVRDELARKGSFLKFDPSRGTKEAYLFNQVFNIAGTLYRANIRHGKTVVGARAMDSDSMALKTELMTDECSYAREVLGVERYDETLDPALMAELESLLNPIELTLIRLLTEEGLQGAELSERICKPAMAISRIKKAIRAKIAGILCDYDIVVPGM